MSLIAMAIPILPGKKATWQAMLDKMGQEPMKSQLNGLRKAAGVRERTFLQETPMGDLVIVTLEGDNPMEAFGKMMSDPAMSDFLEFAKDVHGMDPQAGPPPPPQLVYDSES